MSAPLVIDRDARIVRAAGRPVRLTPCEFDLLAHMADHPTRLHRRENLSLALVGSLNASSTGYVGAVVSRIRRKLAAAGIETMESEYGRGWRLFPAHDDARRLTVVDRDNVVSMAAALAARARETGSGDDAA